MLRSVFVAAAAAVLLAVGALSAMAGNSHGKAVSTLGTSTTLRGEASEKSEAVQPIANAARAAAQTQAQTQAQAETDSDSADEATDEDADDATEDATDEAAAAAPAAAPAVKTEQEGAEHDD
jgi:hypothetical protein